MMDILNTIVRMNMDISHVHYIMNLEFLNL